jgi:GH15 family glucan-1,4-alpha-glucosidase
MRWVSSELYDGEKQVFVTNESNELVIDGFFGAFMFGLTGLDDERIERAADTINRALKTADGLYRRRERDTTASVLASLWMAQYFMEIGQSDKAHEIIAKITRRVSRTGFIDHSDASALPVRASAEYISTLLDTITKL